MGFGHTAAAPADVSAIILRELISEVIRVIDASCHGINSGMLGVYCKGVDLFFTPPPLYLPPPWKIIFLSNQERKLIYCLPSPPLILAPSLNNFSVRPWANYILTAAKHHAQPEKTVLDAFRLNSQAPSLLPP